MAQQPDDLQERVTRILQDLEAQPEAADALLPLVYDQLRAIAQRRMSQERSSHTLQATALVHEAYVRLLGGREVSWESRGQFYAAAAQAMRRILIDHARRRGSTKRGGGRTAVPLSVVDLADSNDPGQIIAVDEAIQRLESEDARAGNVVRLRFYAGLSVDETAEALGLSPRTVMREWTYARARLFQFLE